MLPSDQNSSLSRPLGCAIGLHLWSDISISHLNEASCSFVPSFRGGRLWMVRVLFSGEAVLSWVSSGVSCVCAVPGSEELFPLGRNSQLQ